MMGKEKLLTSPFLNTVYLASFTQADADVRSLTYLPSRAQLLVYDMWIQKMYNTKCVVTNGLVFVHF